MSPKPQRNPTAENRRQVLHQRSLLCKRRNSLRGLGQQPQFQSPLQCLRSRNAIQPQKTAGRFCTREVCCVNAVIPSAGSVNNRNSKALFNVSEAATQSNRRKPPAGSAPEKFAV